jgi:putative colanic acid biosynthesis UDP-glucose lipid carrier transferase
MTEPVILKNSFAVAAVGVLQVALPAAVVVGTLYTVMPIYGVPHSTNADILALLAALLTIALPRQRQTFGTPIFSGSWSLAIGVIFRWGVILTILLAIGYTAKATEEYSRRVIITWALATTPLLLIVTLVLDSAAKGLLRDPMNARKTVFVGINEVSGALAKQLSQRKEFCMSVAGFFDDRSEDRLNVDEGEIKLLGRLKDLATYIKTHGVQVIFIALPMRHLQRVRELLDDLRDTTASIYYVPDIFVFDLIQARSGEIFGIPVVALCETPFYGSRGVAKRLIDVLISGTVLLLAAPFMVTIALLVKLSSRGPAIFKQRRYGLDGREFIVYKFRTMTVTEDGVDIAQATKNDKRITSIGGFLRRHSLDELPQLINVLQGRMSLVGPRPHAIAHNEEYRKLIKGYMIRHKVLPGITGLAQINGCRGETAQLEEMQARINFDLEYLRHWSPVLDFKILALTALQLLRHQKAY